MRATVTYHRTVDIRLSRDAKFRALSKPEPNAQTIFERLLYHPNSTSLPGLIAATLEGLASELGWDPIQYGIRYAELSTLGMSYADWEAGLIWIPNAIKYREPDNLKVIKGWEKFFALLPECDLLNTAKLHIFKYLCVKRANGKPFPEPFGLLYAELYLIPYSIPYD